MIIEDFISTPSNCRGELVVIREFSRFSTSGVSEIGNRLRTVLVYVACDAFLKVPHVYEAVVLQTIFFIVL